METPFRLSGNTVAITAAASDAPAVQVGNQLGADNVGTQQYILTNLGSQTAYVGFGQSASQANANCVVPTGNGTAAAFVIPLLGPTQVTITTAPNSYFAAITATSTTTVLVTPGYGT